jgi:hypothetical protein
MWRKELNMPNTQARRKFSSREGRKGRDCVFSGFQVFSFQILRFPDFALSGFRRYR